MISVNCLLNKERIQPPTHEISTSVMTLGMNWSPDKKNTPQFSLFVSNNATVPDPPQNLQVLAEYNQITLSWQAPTDDGGAIITEYRIYRSESYSWC